MIEGAPGFAIDAEYLQEVLMASLAFENWESLLDILKPRDSEHVPGAYSEEKPVCALLLV
jgi:hypothetical protein